jgi:hypothetical protein
MEIDEAAAPDELVSISILETAEPVAIGALETAVAVT